MLLDDLEYSVLSTFLESINHANKDPILKRYRSLDCVADRRNIIDVGRETDLKSEKSIHIDGINCVFSVRLRINDSSSFDALLFVRNEIIDYFEFNAYGVDWPSEVHSFELYQKSVMIYGADEYPSDRFIVHGFERREGRERFYNFEFANFHFCSCAFYYSAIRGRNYPEEIDGRLFARKVISAENVDMPVGGIAKITDTSIELVGEICAYDVYEADQYLVSKKYYAIKTDAYYVYVLQEHLSQFSVGDWVHLCCGDIFVDIRFAGETLWFLKD